jgi:hypothetical protein
VHSLSLDVARLTEDLLPDEYYKVRLTLLLQQAIGLGGGLPIPQSC